MSATANNPGPTEVTAKQAYEQAGIGPEDIHCFEVQDTDAFCEIEIYESSGAVRAWRRRQADRRGANRNQRRQARQHERRPNQQGRARRRLAPGTGRRNRLAASRRGRSSAGRRTPRSGWRTSLARAATAPSRSCSGRARVGAGCACRSARRQRRNRRRALSLRSRSVDGTRRVSWKLSLRRGIDEAGDIPSPNPARAGSRMQMIDPNGRAVIGIRRSEIPPARSQFAEPRRATKPTQISNSS